MKILGDLLVERGLLTPEKLAAALHEQKVTSAKLGKILVRNGFVRQRDVLDIVREINPDLLHQESVFVPEIPAKILIETHSMVTAETYDALYIATLSKPPYVRRLLEPHVGGRNILFTPVVPQKLETYVEKLIQFETSEIGVLERTIQNAMTVGASDIHIIPRYSTYTVLLRIHGVMSIAHEGTREEYISMVSRIKDRSRMDMAERRKPQDGSFTFEHNGRVIDLRVVAVPTIDGERVVIRILDPDAINPTLETLGISRLAEWEKGVSRPDGLCLICGPTGSGKTTTLNATLRKMSFLDRTIYSAEDPVEYRLPYAGQVNVNPLVGLDFANAVKTFMRADPDVIVVGEVRDIETARNALKAAETGHLVIATLHTGSILGAIGRLRDIGIEPYELRHLLRAVMVQRLVRAFCKFCHGAGCVRCHHKGYGGRTIVSEAAYFSDENAVEGVLKGERTWPSIIEDAKLKVAQGVTDLREIRRIFAAEIESDGGHCADEAAALSQDNPNSADEGLIVPTQGD